MGHTIKLHTRENGRFVVKTVATDKYFTVCPYQVGDAIWRKSRFFPFLIYTSCGRNSKRVTSPAVKTVGNIISTATKSSPNTTNAQESLSSLTMLPPARYTAAGIKFSSRKFQNKEE